MLRLVPSLRPMVSAALIAAMLALPHGLPLHIHPGGLEARAEPLVHAHAVQHQATGRSDENEWQASHGDHRLAVSLTSDSMPAPRPASGVALVPDGPADAPFVVARRLDWPQGGGSAHSPPPDVSVPRGPPSYA